MKKRRKKNKVRNIDTDKNTSTSYIRFNPLIDMNGYTVQSMTKN